MANFISETTKARLCNYIQAELNEPKGYVGLSPSCFGSGAPMSLTVKDVYFNDADQKVTLKFELSYAHFVGRPEQPLTLAQRTGVAREKLGWINCTSKSYFNFKDFSPEVLEGLRKHAENIKLARRPEPGQSQAEANKKALPQSLNVWLEPGAVGVSFRMKEYSWTNKSTGTEEIGIQLLNVTLFDSIFAGSVFGLPASEGNSIEGCTSRVLDTTLPPDLAALLAGSPRSVSVATSDVPVPSRG